MARAIGSALALAIALLLPLAGCSVDDDESGARRASVLRVARSWTGPPERKPGRARLPVSRFNRYLEALDDPPRAPLLLAAAYVGLEEGEGSNTALLGKRTGEAGLRERVEVTLDGLLDDSIRAVRYSLVFERRTPTGSWRLSSARWAQRCQPGRGHQRFEPKRCL